MKQTSIEWFAQQLGITSGTMFEEAKAMYRDEIMSALEEMSEHFDMLNPMNEKPNDGQLNNPIRPPHYKTADMEVWEMMLAIWGNVAFAKHCEMSAFKYRMRAGKKEDNSAQQDLEKAKWYEEKAREYSDV